MFILFLIVFINLVGFGIIIPMLPFYGEHFGASPDQVTLLMAVYSIAQFLTAPFWGRLSDRIGRRPILLISLAGTVVAYIWLAFAPDLTQLYLSRAWGGIMAGSIAGAFAYAADVSDDGNRARAMGLIGAAFGLGFIAGPAIGGLLAGADPANPDFRLPSLAAAGFSLAAFLLALVILKESLSAEARAAAANRPRGEQWQIFLDAVAQPNVRTTLILTFLAIMVFAGLESTFALWTEREFGWGVRQNGYIFAFVGIVSAVIQGLLIAPLARRIGERGMIRQGFLALGIGLAILPFADSLWLLLVAMTVATYGFSVSTPALNSLLSLQVAPEIRGGVLGVGRSVATLGRSVGPAGAGYIFVFLGRDWPFLAGAGVMLVILALSIIQGKRLSVP